MTRIIFNSLGLDWIYDIEEESIKPGSYSGKLLAVELAKLIVVDEATMPVKYVKPKQKAPNHRRPERKLRRGK